MSRFSNDDGTFHLDSVRFFTDTQEALLDELDARAGSQHTTLVVTANVDHTVKYLRNESSRTVLESADLVTLDGAPLVAMARMLGVHNAHRNTGADLLERASSIAAERGWRIAILGGDDEVGRRAAIALRERHIGSVVQHISLPTIHSPDDPRGRDAVEALRRGAPTHVFVCLGFPKQEEWVLAWRSDLPPAVYIGAGAAVDFAAGARKRAPRLVQALGAEWLWRVAQEPRRLVRRYLVESLPFAGLAIRSLVGRRSENGL